MAISQTNPAINEAWGFIKVLSGDEQTRALAEAREKARMDMDSWLSDARYEGRQEGIFEVARNALREKMPVETMAQMIGLPMEEVKKLAADLS